MMDASLAGKHIHFVTGKLSEHALRNMLERLAKQLASGQPGRFLRSHPANSTGHPGWPDDRSIRWLTTVADRPAGRPY